jgi:hypothetical protein
MKRPPRIAAARRVSAAEEAHDNAITVNPENRDAAAVNM